MNNIYERYSALPPDERLLFYLRLSDEDRAYLDKIIDILAPLTEINERLIAATASLRREMQWRWN